MEENSFLDLGGAEKVAGLIKLFDGWANIYQGLGVNSRDPDASDMVVKSYINDEECRTLYEDIGITRRMVQLRANGMYRMGITITGDKDGGIGKFLKKNGLIGKCREAQEFADVFGGSLLILGINDGAKDLGEPLNETLMRNLLFAEVADKTCASVAEWEMNPMDANYMKPKVYWVAINGANTFRVHHSRTIKFDGEFATNSSYLHNNLWHNSFYKAVKERARRLLNANDDTGKQIRDLYKWVYKMKGLSDYLNDNDKGDADVQRRLRQLQVGGSYLSMMAIDEDESLDKVQGSGGFSGIDGAIQAIERLLQASSGIPNTLLMGTKSSGMSAGDGTGEQYWYDGLTDRQESHAYRQLIRLCTVVMGLKEGPTGGVVIEDFDIVFNPLRTMDEKEEADVRRVQSETDKNYYEMGVLDSSEIRSNRFLGEQSNSTSVEAEDPEISDGAITGKLLTAGLREGDDADKPEE